MIRILRQESQEHKQGPQSEMRGNITIEKDNTSANARFKILAKIFMDLTT